MREVNMEKHWAALCALILVLSAMVDLDTVAASHADAASRGTSLLHPSNLQVEMWMCLFGFHLHSPFSPPACWLISFQ